MEDPVPDLHYYMRIAKNKGISEDCVRAELIDLIDETKSYIGAMQIFIKRLSKGNLDIYNGDVNEKKSENSVG